MIFPYLRLPGHPDPALRPYVEARLFYKDKRTSSIFFLVDSGSDYTYADYNIAIWLGIDLKGVKPITPFGVKGKPFKSYPFNTGLSIGGHEIKLPVLYTKDYGREGIIGEEVFFDNFRVIFERYKWRLELVPKFTH